MNSKLRFVIFLGVLGILTSLLVAVFPLSGATGVVDFKDPSDATLSLSWAKQEGTVTIDVVDSDLNVPQKRVLIPAVAGTDVSALPNAVTATTVAGSTTITFSTSTTLASGDTILVSGETVREVAAAITAATSTTVTTPFVGAGAGRTVNKVDVTDGSFDSCPDCAEALVVRNSASTEVSDLLSLVDTNVGIALSNRFAGAPDTALNVQDVRLVQDDGTPFAGAFTVDLVNGLLSLTGGSVPTNALYWTATTNLIKVGTGIGTVKVTSDADPTGISISLQETGTQSGVFRTGLTGGPANLLLSATSSDAAIPRLQVNKFDTVRVTYFDEGAGGASFSRSKTIKVETTAPAFGNQSPADSNATVNNLPTVSGEVTDGDSGVDDTTIQVIFGIDTSDPADEIIDEESTVDVLAADISTITGGNFLVQRLPSALSKTTDNVIHWWIKTLDTAGNVGISDRLGTIGGALDTCDSSSFPGSVVGVDVDAGTTAGDATPIGLCQSFRIFVDRTPPDMTGAVAGSWWDANKGGDDKTETDVTKSLNTSIRVDFNEALDGATVARTDFQVDGSVPVDAVHFAGAPKSVFLTVAALAPDARPKVEVVSNLTDNAGNTTNSDIVDPSTDGIAPTLTLTVGTVARPVTNTTVAVTLDSNETASTANTNIRTIQIKSFTHAVGTSDETVESITGGPTSWTTDAGTGGGDGLYNVWADATDINVTTNTGKTGTDPFADKTLAVTLTCSASGTDNSFDSSTTPSTVPPFADINGSGTVTGADFTPSAFDAGTFIDVTVVGGSETGDLTVNCTHGILTSDTGSLAYKQAGIVDLTTAALFEVDKGIPDPAFPLTAAGTDNPNTFIAVDFTDEGREYGLLADKSFVTLAAHLAADPANTGADITTSFDTHGTVTVVEATLDGTDISGDISTTDNIKLLYKASALTEASHTVVIKVTDEASNEKEFTHTFTVAARAKFSVPLIPGWNLVSFPGAPSDASVEAVIGDVPVTSVYTFDPSLPGGWLVAVREIQTDGTLTPFVGTLTTISANRGYWVLTDTFEALLVDIPQLAAGAVDSALPPQPPTISVGAGWNLIPVLDVTGTLTASSTIDSDVYLAGLSVSRVYLFDTLTGAWTLVVPDGIKVDTSTADDLKVGKAYWVYATEAGTLVP